MRRWSIFLSGRGSNAEAFFENLPELDVGLCVSSSSNAYGLRRARRLGIPTLVFTKSMDWKTLSSELKLRKINQILLLGFMKILPAEFVSDWAGRIWNLHPSLLPEHPGLNAIEKSYEAGLRMGVSLHQVTAEMDAGPLILQTAICENAKREFSLSDAEFKISRTEQRLVRELARRKNPQAGGRIWN